MPCSGAVRPVIIVVWGGPSDGRDDADDAVRNDAFIDEFAEMGDLQS